jgi:hypothetical protein
MEHVARGVQGLDMAEFVHEGTAKGPLLYDCFAFSSHMGTFSGGHYTAFARNPPSTSCHPQQADGEASASVGGAEYKHPWFLFNDGCVSRVPDSSMDTRSAYLLFYRRRADAEQDPPDLVAQCLCASAASRWVPLIQAAQIYWTLQYKCMQTGRVEAPLKVICVSHVPVSNMHTRSAYLLFSWRQADADRNSLGFLDSLDQLRFTEPSQLACWELTQTGVAEFAASSSCFSSLRTYLRNSFSH